MSISITQPRHPRSYSPITLWFVCCLFVVAGVDIVWRVSRIIQGNTMLRRTPLLYALIRPNCRAFSSKIDLDALFAHLEGLSHNVYQYFIIVLHCSALFCIVLHSFALFCIVFVSEVRQIKYCCFDFVTFRRRGTWWWWWCESYTPR